MNELTDKVIGLAIEGHRHLGPGLLESTSEACLAYELRKAGLPIETQIALPGLYKGVQIDAGYRRDILIEKKLILEIKAVEQLLPIHQARLLTHLKLSDLTLGLLINFNVKLLKDGIVRLVNKLPELNQSTPHSPR
jgi:GxxExxY protein